MLKKGRFWLVRIPSRSRSSQKKSLRSVIQAGYCRTRGRNSDGRKNGKIISFLKKEKVKRGSPRLLFIVDI